MLVHRIRSSKKLSDIVDRLAALLPNLAVALPLVLNSSYLCSLKSWDSHGFCCTVRFPRAVGAGEKRMATVEFSQKKLLNLGHCLSLTIRLSSIFPPSFICLASRFFSNRNLCQAMVEAGCARISGSDTDLDQSYVDEGLQRE